MPDHIYQLLLVEDSQAEAHLFKEVLRTWAVRHLLSVVKDGWEAMAFLHHHGYFSDSPKPDLIFLDLAMPGLDGFETLRQIRSDPDIEVARKIDRKSTRLNSSHANISYAVFCLKNTK